MARKRVNPRSKDLPPAKRIQPARAARNRPQNPTSTPTLAPEKQDEFFHYTNSEDIIPREINNFIFNPADWEDITRPVGFLPKSKWPPQSADVLLKANKHDGPCVGRRCWEQDYCDDKKLTCGHTLEEWIQGTEGWKELFELRQTENRGIGVFTKTAWGNGDILGWMNGVLKPDTEDAPTNNYCLNVPIGRLEAKEDRQAYAIIDPLEQGNWVRFVNHDCKPLTKFGAMRVGKTRLVVIEAIKKISPGVELTVNYGNSYFASGRTCLCGREKCISTRKS
ncbi:SET domain-containing protein [Glonium stellatum]|uniref:SET domain-containing protein n=1 Tax=Glonium stellatum TaxID=574774 RepID=A0A8E2EZ36_9PEZI|nr:SET domain-containing protein [Glonium stellatum]